MEDNENKLILQVFQYSENSYIIGFVDPQQLNSSDFAININHPLSLVFDSTYMVFRVFQETIVDTTKIFNLSKSKVISVFSPTQSLIDEYLEIIVSFEDTEIDDYDNYIEMGTIQ